MFKLSRAVAVGLLMSTVFTTIGPMTGCAGLKSALESADKPTGKIVGAKLQDLSLESASILLDVELTNPYNVPLPVVGLDYGLSSGGKKFLTGSGEQQGAIPASGKKVISVPAKVTFAQLIGVVEGVRPGKVVPYQADVAVSVDAPVVGKLSLPMTKTGEVPVPAVPDVSVQDVQWSKLTLDEAAATINLKVKNTNEFAADLAAMSYGVSLGDHKVATGQLANAASLKPGQEQTLTIPVSLKPRDLGLAAFNMLTGKGSGYKVDGNMSLGTPFGPVNLPYSKTGQTTFKK